MRRNVYIRRDQSGIPHVEAENEAGMFWGQGCVHATDRGLQMLLMRILGQGRASEILDSSDDTLRVDTFFRRMNWKANTRGEIDSLDPPSRRHLEAYCEGVNSVLAKHWPWEFKLFGYRPEEWTCDHSIMVARMVGYLTLVQSQAEIERLLVELVKAGVSREKLYELFPGILGGLDIDLLKSVTLGERIVPGDVLWDVSVPRMMASNNWVISGAKTASGKPIVANDPHLEANRLPAVWNEIVLKTKDRYLIGGSMPGFPGVLTGRTRDMAWGVTYAFVDAIDSWVEHCRDGRYYREEGTRWVDFSRRKGRDTTFMPSFRMVTDLAREESFSNLAGGPSDRRFSKWYCSDLANWMDGGYKRITPASGQAKLPFEYREFDPAMPTISHLAELARRIMIDVRALIEKLPLHFSCAPHHSDSPPES